MSYSLKTVTLDYDFLAKVIPEGPQRSHLLQMYYWRSSYPKWDHSSCTWVHTEASLVYGTGRWHKLFTSKWHFAALCLLARIKYKGLGTSRGASSGWRRGKRRPKALNSNWHAHQQVSGNCPVLGVWIFGAVCLRSCVIFCELYSDLQSK